MKTVLSIIGTRPEAIKMAPVIKELNQKQSGFRSIVCSTGQHRQMLDQVLSLFQIKPDVDLELMQTNQTLSQLTASLFTGIDRAVVELRPDWVLAQGDTIGHGGRAGGVLSSHPVRPRRSRSAHGKSLPPVSGRN